MPLPKAQQEIVVEVDEPYVYATSNGQKKSEKRDAKLDLEDLLQKRVGSILTEIPFSDVERRSINELRRSVDEKSFQLGSEHD